VVFRGEFIPADSYVNGHLYADCMASVNLLLKKIPVKMRVPAGEIRVIVNHSMMTPGKTGNGVHAGVLQGLSKFLGIKLLPYAFNLLRGVKIQMYLTKSEFSHSETSF
jgi:hypothetical protein